MSSIRSTGSLDGNTISGGKLTSIPSVPLPMRRSHAAKARNGVAFSPLLQKALDTHVNGEVVDMPVGGAPHD